VWTYIQKSNLESFINKYPQLAEGFDDINLYETDDRIFLPRLFYKNYPDGVEVFKSSEQILPSPTFFKFTGTLREGQVESVNTVLDYTESTNMFMEYVKCHQVLVKLW
jgi:hypothetical protein